MSGVSVEPADLAKIAKAAGRSGKGLPEWAVGKPDLEDAYYAGAGVAPPDRTPAPKDPAPEKRPKPATSGATSPKRSRAGAPATSSGGGPARQSSASSTSWKQAAASRLTPGSAGGVMIAAFIYPCILAGLEAGPGGVVEWLKAKFLNKTPQKTTPKKSSNGPKIIAPGPALGGVNYPTVPTPKGHSA